MFELYFSQLYNSFCRQNEHNIEIFSIEDFKEEFYMLTSYNFLYNISLFETKTFHDFARYIQEEKEISKYKDDECKAASRKLLTIINPLIKILLQPFWEKTSSQAQDIPNYPLFSSLSGALKPDTSYINQLQKQNPKFFKTEVKDLKLFKDFTDKFVKSCDCLFYNLLAPDPKSNNTCPECFLREILNFSKDNDSIPLAKYFSYRTPDFFILFQILDSLTNFPQVEYVKQGYCIDNVHMSLTMMKNLYKLFYSCVKHLANKAEPIQAILVYEWFDKSFSFDLLFSIIKDTLDKDTIIYKYSTDTKQFPIIITSLSYFQELPSSAFKSIAYTKFKEGLQKNSPEGYDLINYCTNFVKSLVEFCRNISNPYQYAVANFSYLSQKTGITNIDTSAYKNYDSSNKLFELSQKKHSALKELSESHPALKLSEKKPIPYIFFAFYHFKSRTPLNESFLPRGIIRNISSPEIRLEPKPSLNNLK